jgi:predicted metal-dependent HD superfamily phosphohydrolase
MANSDLQGKRWKIPPQYMRKLKQRFQNFKGNKKAEGYVRLKNLLSQGSITYENLKFIKHTLEKNKNDEQLYQLNGGEEFERWINDTLSTARKALESNKKAKKNLVWLMLIKSLMKRIQVLMQLNQEHLSCINQWELMI